MPFADCIWKIFITFVMDLAPLASPQQVDGGARDTNDKLLNGTNKEYEHIENHNVGTMAVGTAFIARLPRKLRCRVNRRRQDSHDRGL